MTSAEGATIMLSRVAPNISASFSAGIITDSFISYPYIPKFPLRIVLPSMADYARVLKKTII
jgi:mannitol-specific phosphotransferase system IIBC component